jgi:hypothetical protein
VVESTELAFDASVVLPEVLSSTQDDSSSLSLMTLVPPEL